MRRKAFILLPFLLLIIMSGRAGAQSIDPTLAAMIVLYTEKAENTLHSQEEAMLLESTGHVWIKERSSTTTSIPSTGSSRMQHRYTGSTTKPKR